MKHHTVVGFSACTVFLRGRYEPANASCPSRTSRSQLGQPLPADYRDFLLDDANEDAGEWGFFIAPEDFLYCELDWTKDFPFSLEHPVDDSPLREFYKRAVHAEKVEHDSNKYNALYDESFDYMVENFLQAHGTRNRLRRR